MIKEELRTLEKAKFYLQQDYLAGYYTNIIDRIIAILSRIDTSKFQSGGTLSFIEYKHP